MSERFKVAMDYGDGSKILIGKVATRKEGYDWNWYPVIKIENMEDYENEFDKKWHVDLRVVSPAAAGKTNVERALDCCGYTDEFLSKETKAIALAEYGVFSLIWQKSGNNLKLLLREARNEAALPRMMFGFKMDQRQNVIGATGWDTIKGELVPKHLRSKNRK